MARRMRATGTGKAGGSVTADVSGDGRFVVTDVVGPAVRLMDLSSADDEKEVSGRDRESTAKTFDISVLSRNVFATSAAIANEAVRKRCGRGRSMSTNGTAVMMAVGGDDGSITIVEQFFPWR